MFCRNEVLAWALGPRNFIATVIRIRARPWRNPLFYLNQVRARIQKSDHSAAHTHMIFFTPRPAFYLFEFVVQSVRVANLGV